MRGTQFRWCRQVAVAPVALVAAGTRDLGLYDPVLDALLAVVVAVVLGWYLSWTAARLDRLHARVEGARSALDAQLARRAAATSTIATSGKLDPASSILLAQAAHDAREAEPEEHDQRESDLTAALRAAFDEAGALDDLPPDPAGSAMVAELAAACRRVELARRFYNDAVRSARVVRRKRIVRVLRLAGRAPLPATVEIDDEVPEALSRPGPYDGGVAAAPESASPGAGDVQLPQQRPTF